MMRLKRFLAVLLLLSLSFLNSPPSSLAAFNVSGGRAGYSQAAFEGEVNGLLRQYYQWMKANWVVDSQAVGNGPGYYFLNPGTLTNGNPSVITEGQEYLMAMAFWAGDRTVFEGAWNWTRTNMKRSGDNLFKWRVDPATPVGASTAVAPDGDLQMVVWVMRARQRGWLTQADEDYVRQMVVDLRTIMGYTLGNGRQLLKFSTNDTVALPGGTHIGISPSYHDEASYRWAQRLETTPAGQQFWRHVSVDGWQFLEQATALHPLSLPPNGVKVNLTDYSMVGWTEQFSNPTPLTVSAESSRTYYRVLKAWKQLGSLQARRYLINHPFYLTTLKANGTLPGAYTEAGVGTGGSIDVQIAQALAVAAVTEPQNLPALFRTYMKPRWKQATSTTGFFGFDGNGDHVYTEYFYPAVVFLTLSQLVSQPEEPGFITTYPVMPLNTAAPTNPNGTMFTAWGATERDGFGVSGSLRALDRATVNGENVLSVNIQAGAMSTDTSLRRGVSFSLNYPLDNDVLASGNIRFAPTERLEFGYDVMFPAGFDFVRMGKLNGIGIGTTGGGGGSGGDGVTNALARCMWRTPAGGSGNTMPLSGGAYMYTPSHPDGTDVGFGGNAPASGVFSFQRGVWHSMRHVVQLNSVYNGAGNADGVYQIYQDGKLMVEIRDVKFRDNYRLGAYGGVFSVFRGGNQAADRAGADHSVYFRNIWERRM